ncbi:(R)-specific enoyl-CoA hydratase RipB/Ich [Pseudonocardia ailaonensis]|uniref:(R)-specific enoyl-CoA hydratase RipB/Ich n=1 Tax=Pseudonocardia ailaonensis TaxID=367279 RepID=A0ABN2N8R8_9PSEU
MPGRGRYFEDFAVGDVYRHAMGRTVTETDNVWFTLLTMNTAQVHVNAEVARVSEFGRPLVNSTLTLAVVGGLTVADTSENAVANLGWENIRLTRPVFAGDTLWAESAVLAVRESGSRPEAGIVTVKSRGLNQEGAEVLSYVRTFMVHKRGSSRGRSAFPTPRTPLLDDGGVE